MAVLVLMLSNELQCSSDLKKLIIYIDTTTSEIDLELRYKDVLGL